MSEKIYDPVFATEPAVLDAFADFVAIVRQLRRDCPWDREQTHTSVKHLFIEETYEVVEAIDNQNWEELKKELGDVLLHVVFHSAIAEGEQEFALADVIETESAKLVRRHPHVFGDTAVSGVEEVLANWERIKLTEGRNKRGVLAGVPAELPGLLRAYRMQEKAAAVGFDFATAEAAWVKVEEELGEFKKTVEGDLPADEQEGELGDLLFALVNYARLAGFQPENALRRTNAKFARRVQYIEQKLDAEGKTMAGMDLETLDRYWDEAKAAGL
ncbi:MAG: nucleoside triphosphate pyrophosphohydrolase [Rhodothermales bacterium]